ncbi:Xylose import ATP-binding protein XylG [Corynebacterium capitovis DSM 44611]|uniref:ATP-binding cassette domain-containing protein n=1 Tax=Corynebacterium capitovis TaxID=131081 RepID=UPI00037A2E88|nr:ATP-binding cassette domain-containing protein [Corynebacterium capitovis]WKD57590.1 Xylose import ATP-binding protein XylG [Corynebacterium capitovis DSM 44611]
MAIIELRDISKSYGSFQALQGINLSINEGEVTCVLGDNGAGKSTLIKVLSGLHEPTSGQILVDGSAVRFSSPRDAIARGIATVHQNLAIVNEMSVWRNFFLGQEITGPLGTLKAESMRRICGEQLREMGISIPDVDVEAGTLSGGQRQVVAIARAVYFGARVLILDEPTAALGVKQSGVVLRFVAAARDRGVGVVLITHNPHHAYLVGDHFTILKLGRQELDVPRREVSLDNLTLRMAGGGELEELSHELRREP